MEKCLYENSADWAVSALESALGGGTDATVRCALHSARNTLGGLSSMPLLFDLLPYKRRLEEAERRFLLHEAEQEVALLEQFAPRGPFAGQTAHSTLCAAETAIATARAAGGVVTLLEACVAALRPLLNLAGPTSMEDPKSAQHDPESVLYRK